MTTKKFIILLVYFLSNLPSKSDVEFLNQLNGSNFVGIQKNGKFDEILIGRPRSGDLFKNQILKEGVWITIRGSNYMRHHRIENNSITVDGGYGKKVRVSVDVIRKHLTRKRDKQKQ